MQKQQQKKKRHGTTALEGVSSVCNKDDIAWLILGEVCMNECWYYEKPCYDWILCAVIIQQMDIQNVLQTP